MSSENVSPVSEMEEPTVGAAGSTEIPVLATTHNTTMTRSEINMTHDTTATSTSAATTPVAGTIVTTESVNAVTDLTPVVAPVVAATTTQKKTRTKKSVQQAVTSFYHDACKRGFTIDKAHLHTCAENGVELNASLLDEISSNLIQGKATVKQVLESRCIPTDIPEEARRLVRQFNDDAHSIALRVFALLDNKDALANINTSKVRDAIDRIDAAKSGAQGSAPVAA